MKQRLAKLKNNQIEQAVLGVLVCVSTCFPNLGISASEPELMVPVEDVHFQELPPPGLLEPDTVPVITERTEQSAPVTKRVSRKQPEQQQVVDKPKTKQVITKRPKTTETRQLQQKKATPGAFLSATTPVQTLQAQARRGNPQAQYQLGLRYQYGNGVAKTPSKAHRWLSKAAKAGNARAQFALSQFYQQYARNRPGLKKALLWLKKAADQGLPEAQYNLGMMFKNGTLVYANEAESRKWLQKAAAQGYELAQLELE